MPRRTLLGARDRALLGVIVLLAGPGLSVGRWHSTREPLETLAWIEQHRSERDSAAYASALYHAGHARAAREAKWGLTGYATHGIGSALLGAGLLMSARRRRGAST